ncbi:SusC/RagA family TonB-linked outer membrane protein [Sinomicrobium soli]|uniref:SusC/RagA family TonB-linked outer membrane protein n=1 Tax=Sinomicrobium sp. N-1-3-6 TaxID=2219864 RepID=UPI000DCDB61B|nr:TonB-dependent receptor [Sinomicrobium sp. N-1-3-6]RAV27636.1 SusC/RagA family TonB-linked outer membrane protein [Sinomicrobium sp. N-1-3-6]
MNNNVLYSLFLFFFTGLAAVNGQEWLISGTVRDTTGLPLAGASVAEKGTDNGAQTDMDGAFTLEVSDADAVLEVSFIGFVAREIPVDGQEEITVTLEQDVTGLDEVVVIGYGNVKKSDLTGAVSQVSAEEVSAFPTTSVMQSLQGRAPGVQVSQSTGAPGAAVSVRIRGSNSIQGNNDPLYVIDGFPYSGAPTNINNADIESIEVLKDASATAIYGSRGANGVVMITTKKGREGATRVELETSYSMQWQTSKLDLLNGREYALLMNLQAQNDNQAPYFSDNEVNGFGRGFDWQDFVFGEGAVKSHSITVSGGNEKTKFSLGGSIFDNEGIVEGSDYKRYSGRLNLSHEISDKVRVEWNNSLSYLETYRKDSRGGSRGNSLIGAAIAAAPISTPYNEDGSYRVLADEYPFVAPDIVNPVNFIREQSNKIKANVVLSNLAFVFNPVPELTVRIAGGIENRDDRTDSYTSRNFHNSNGSASVTTNQERSLLSENTVTYEKTFNDAHRLSALAGFTYQNFTREYVAGSGVGFISDAFESYQLQVSETPGIPSSGYSESTLLSYLGRINYAFKDRYLLTFSMRRDGSSRYSEGSKWGNFPSAALAWRAGEEPFIKKLNFFSDLKLRGSWGLVGSQAIDPYTTLNVLLSGKTVFDDQLYNTLAPGTRLPGDLKWETTEQWDVGMDIGLLNNRISLTLDYYVKNTRDLLNTVPLPSSMGYLSTIRNVGEVQNKGFEVGVSGAVFTGEFQWDLSANLSSNKNKVVHLYGGEDILTSYVSALVVQDNIAVLSEGRPMGQFWGYREDGYDEQGQIKLMDLNGDGTLSPEDKTYIGDPNPDFIYGLNSYMSYKNFSLSFFIQGSQGNDIFNVSAIPVTMDYGQGLNTLREVYLDHWSPGNPDAKYPLISRNTSAYASDRWVEDGSYVRLKNIELAYSIPLENSFIEKSQLYISGQNLITITDYSWWDPEVNSQGADSPGIDYLSYPVAKGFTVGLRMTF